MFKIHNTATSRTTKFIRMSNPEHGGKLQTLFGVGGRPIRLVAGRPAEVSIPDVAAMLPSLQDLTRKGLIRVTRIDNVQVSLENITAAELDELAKITAKVEPPLPRTDKPFTDYTGRHQHYKETLEGDLPPEADFQMPVAPPDAAIEMPVVVEASTPQNLTRKERKAAKKASQAVKGGTAAVTPTAPTTIEAKQSTATDSAGLDLTSITG
jgi:hypothetical protein